MPKLQSNFTEIALRHCCSPVNLLHIFRTTFPKNTSGQLLLTTLLLFYFFSVFQDSRLPTVSKNAFIAIENPYLNEVFLK